MIWSDVPQWLGFADTVGETMGLFVRVLSTFDFGFVDRLQLGSAWMCERKGTRRPSAEA